MYAPSPFSSLQSQPFHQALGPLTQMQQGQGGSFGPAPFAYIPPVPTVPQPAFHGAGFQQMGFRQSIVGSAGFGTFATPPNPWHQLSAMQQMPLQAGAVGVGAGIGAMRLAGGGLAAMMGMGAMRAALPAVMPALGVLGRSAMGAWGAGGMMGAAGHLGGGILRAGAMLAAPAAPWLAGLGAVGLGGAALSVGARGFQQYRDVYTGLNESLGHMSGLPGSGPMGRGIGAGTAGMLTQVAQATGSQSFRRTSESIRVLQNLAASGDLVSGARNTADLRRNIEQAFDTIGQIMDVVNSTFEEAGQLFTQVRKMGFSSKGGMLKAVMNANIQGGMAGMSASQMLAVGEQGSAMARSAGLYGAGGAALNMGLTASLGAGFRTGALSRDLYSELTGGTMDPTQAAGRMAGSVMGHLQGKGQYMLAGLFNQAGGLDTAGLQDVVTGKASFQGLLSRGTSAVNRDIAGFANRRPRLASKLMEEAGSQMYGLMYQQLKSQAALTGDTSDDMIQLMAKNQLGMTDVEARALTDMGNPDAQRQQLLLAEQVKKSRARETLYSKQLSMGAQWERQVRTPLAGMGRAIATPFTQAGAALGKWGEGLMEYAAGIPVPDEGGPLVDEHVRRYLRGEAGLSSGMTAQEAAAEGYAQYTGRVGGIRGLISGAQMLTGQRASRLDLFGVEAGGMFASGRGDVLASRAQKNMGVGLLGSRLGAVADALQKGSGDWFAQTERAVGAFAGGTDEKSLRTALPQLVRNMLSSSKDQTALIKDIKELTGKQLKLEELNSPKMLKAFQDLDYKKLSNVYQTQIGGATSALSGLPGTTVFGAGGAYAGLVSLGLMSQNTTALGTKMSEHSMYAADYWGGLAGEGMRRATGKDANLWDQFVGSMDWARGNINEFIANKLDLGGYVPMADTAMSLAAQGMDSPLGQVISKTGGTARDQATAVLSNIGSGNQGLLDQLMSVGGSREDLTQALQDLSEGKSTGLSRTLEKAFGAITRKTSEVPEASQRRFVSGSAAMLARIATKRAGLPGLGGYEGLGQEYLSVMADGTAGLVGGRGGSLETAFRSTAEERSKLVRDIMKGGVTSKEEYEQMAELTGGSKRGYRAMLGEFAGMRKAFTKDGKVDLTQATAYIKDRAKSLAGGFADKVVDGKTVTAQEQAEKALSGLLESGKTKEHAKMYAGWALAGEQTASEKAMMDSSSKLGAAADKLEAAATSLEKSAMKFSETTGSRTGPP